MPTVTGRLRTPALASAPATPAVGEIYYNTATNQLFWWNGTIWVVNPKITSSAFSGGPPASPTDGDIWIATGVDGGGLCWQFRYNAGSASAYKWEFIGGGQYTFVATATPTWNLNTWTPFNSAPATAWQAARPGEYVVGGSWSNVNGASAGTSRAGIMIYNGTSYANPGWYSGASINNSGYDFNVAVPPYVYALATTSYVVALGYWTNLALGAINHRAMSIQPVRVS